MKTHWKKLHNPDFIGAYAFQPNQEIVATIAKANVENVTGSNGKSEQCMVVHFKEKDLKPLICNVTNSKAIARVAGSDYIEDWANVAITLFTTQVQAFGDTVQAVRVRTIAPKIELEELKSDHPRWDGAVQSIKNGQIDIDGIKKHFKLSTKNEKLLMEQSNA
jgi:hypothetical protein